MSARRSVLSSLVAGIVFVSSAPAWAVYTKFINVEKTHTDGGDGLKVEGRLILDGNKNPTPLPADGEKCPKDRTVKIQRKKASGTGWRTVGTATTDNGGDFSKTVDDKAGRYRFKASETTKGKALCYQATKRFRHDHS